MFTITIFIETEEYVICLYSGEQATNFYTKNLLSPAHIGKSSYQD